MRLFVRLTAALEALLNPDWAIPMVDSAYQRGYQAAVAAGAAELSTSRAANEQLRARLEAMEKRPKPKNRGVIISRVTAEGIARDEYPLADSWSCEPVVVDATQEAWLNLLDMHGKQIATYKPGYWFQVESGKTGDIKESQPEAEQPTA